MRIILRLFGLLKKYWKRLIITYVFLLLTAATALAVPWLIDLAMNKGLPSNTNAGNQSLLIYFGLAIIGDPDI